jgi:hypothetical protein
VRVKCEDCSCEFDSHVICNMRARRNSQSCTYETSHEDWSCFVDMVLYRYLATCRSLTHSAKLKQSFSHTLYTTMPSSYSFKDIHVQIRTTPLLVASREWAKRTEHPLRVTVLPSHRAALASRTAVKVLDNSQELRERNQPRSEQCSGRRC